MNKQRSLEEGYSALQLFYSYLNNNIATHGNRYAGFVLDIANPRSSGRMGIGATCLALSMYSMIPNNDGRHVSEMERYILSKRQANGSWTISPLLPHNVSLIYTTCYALQGIARSGQPQNVQVLKEGVNWLIDVSNSDGGWGLTEHSASHVHPTSEVLFLFSLLKWLIDPAVFLAARDWLLGQRVDGTYWVNEESKPSLFLTGLAYRGLISTYNFQYELSSTRKWLAAQLPTVPCVEETRYYLPAGNNFIIEPITCFTRAVVFEALSANAFSDYEPSIEYEAKRLLKSRDVMGFWRCDASSAQVPIYLNYHICSGLVNYVNYLERRPSRPWVHDSKEFFTRYPVFSTTIVFITLIGLFAVVGNLLPLLDWLWKQGRQINQYFENLSGVANFFQITGLSVIAIALFLYRFLRKKSK